MGLQAKPNLTRLSVLAVAVAVAKRGSKQGVEIGDEKATQKGLDVQPFFSEEGCKAKISHWFKDLRTTLVLLSNKSIQLVITKCYTKCCKQGFEITSLRQQVGISWF